MQLNNLFKRSKPAEETKEAQVQAAPEPTKSCPRCQTELTSSQLEAQHYVCSCGYHFRMPARKRLMNLVGEEGKAPRQQRRKRGHYLRHRLHRRPKVRHLRDGTLFYDGFHGLCCGRKGDPSLRVCHPQ